MGDAGPCGLSRFPRLLRISDRRADCVSRDLGLRGNAVVRFSSFAFGPFAALRYLRDLLRRRQPHFVGHNPAGSWSIFNPLTLGVLSVLSGVAALGGEKQQGPLRGLLTFARRVTRYGESAFGPRLTHAGGRGDASSRCRREQSFGPRKPSRSDDSRPQTRAARRSVGLARQQCGDRAAGGARRIRRLGDFRGYFKASGDAPYLPFAGPALCHGPTMAARMWKLSPRLSPVAAAGTLVAGDARRAGPLRRGSRARCQGRRLIVFLRRRALGRARRRRRRPGRSHRGTPAGSTPLRITEITY